MSGEDASAARQPPPGRRIVDADRNRVVAMLQKAAGEGALDLVELDQRLSEVYAAKTSGQLAMVVHALDLDRPAAAPARQPRERGLLWRSTGFRYHAGAYGLTNGFLVGTWALTTPGGFFWPFFPAAGWGIGLGMHAMAAATSVARTV